MKTKLIILFAFLALGVQHANAIVTRINYPVTSTLYVDSVKINTSVSGTTVRLTFTMTGGYYYTPGNSYTIQFVQPSSTTIYYFNPADLSASATITPVGGITSIPDGTYSVAGTYFATGSWIAIGGSDKTNVRIETKTLPPAFMLPADSATAGNSFVIQDSIPEADHTHTKTITLTGANTYVITLTDALKDSFALDVTNPLASSSVYSMTNGPSIANGTYTMTFSYRDSVGHTSSSSPGRTITINAVTPSPIITSPATSASIGGPVMSFQFTIPDNYKHGTVTMVFDSSGTTDTVVFKNTLAKGANTVTLNAGNLLSSSFVQSATMNTLNGIYNITLSYQDSAGYPASSTTVTNVSIDNTTQPATLISPINATFGGTDSLRISFALPETASAGSVRAMLSNASTTCLITFLSSASGTTSVVLNHWNVAWSAGVASSIPSSIPDGTYSLTIQYQDAFGNPLATSNAGTVVMDYTTETPAFISPANNDTGGPQMKMKLNLPEAPLNGTVYLSIYNGSVLDSVELKNMTAGVDSFTLDVKNLSASPYVQWARYDTLSSGTYTFMLSYRDTLGNSANFAQSTGVLIDLETQVPTLLSPLNAVGGGVDPVYFHFTLPETAADSSLQFILDNGTSADTITLYTTASGTSYFFLDPKNLTNIAGYKSSTVHSLTDGTYTVTLLYRDTYGNAAATSNAGTMLVDETTLTPIMVQPYTGSITNGTIPVTFSIPENALGDTASLVLSGPYNIQMHVQTSGSGIQHYMLNTDSLALTPGVIAPSQSSVPEGIYTLTVSYNDTLWNNAASAAVSNIKIDRTTLNPVLTSPASSSTIGQFITVNFTIPETHSQGTVVLTFDSAGTQTYLTLSDTFHVGTNTFLLNTNNLAISGSIQQIVPSSKKMLGDGIYSVSLSYMDSLANPSAVVVNTNITIDKTTQAPVLLSPVNGALIGGGNALPISFTLPEKPQTNTVTIKFDNGVNPVCTLILNTDSAGTSSINLNPHHLLGTTGLTFITYDSLYDGFYTVTLSYQDALGNPPASSTGHMILDETTQPPVITSPVSSGTLINLMMFQFTVPEKYSPNSLKLVFDKAGVKDTVVLTNTFRTGADTLILESYNIRGSFQVQSSTTNSLSDGIYSVTLSYGDSLGNPVASATVANVTLDQVTTPPVLISPTNVLQATSTVFNLQYTLPETPLSGTVSVEFIDINGSACSMGLDETTSGTKTNAINLKSLPTSFSYTSSSCNSIDDGTYKVVVMYQDAFDNGLAVSDTGLLIVDTQTLTPSLTLPGSNSTNTATIDVSFSLPENALTNRAFLTFTNITDTVSIELMTNGNTGLQTRTLDGDDLVNTSGFASSSQASIPDGIYTLTVSYQDTLSNAYAMASQSNVTVSRIVTGTKEVIGNSAVSIYPNPSNGAFTIHSTTEGTFTIMDELGNAIRTVKLGNANNYTVTDATLSSGIYFIVGYNHNNVTREKLVIVK